MKLHLTFGGLLEATQKVSRFYDFQKMTPWEVNYLPALENSRKLSK